MLENKCELCNLEKKTKWYFEDDKWIICDCLTCGIPMLIYKKHTMEIPAKDLSYIFHLLRYNFDDPKRLFGREFNKITFRMSQRKIKDHFHIHFMLRNDN